MTIDESRVAIDGRFVDRERASISVFDRGFLYGDSIFETTRTYGGTPFLLGEHMARLAWSAERVGLTLPLSPDELEAEVATLAREAGASPTHELSLRLMITRGEGPLGLDPRSASHPRRVLFVQPVRPLPAVWYREGVSVVSFATYRPSDSARGAKVGNYLESILATAHARERDAHEALILGHDGHVLEGTTSNVFVVRGGVLFTPPTSESILPGITRRLVLEAADALSIDVSESRIDPPFVASGDEAFLTSSLREVLPVSAIDGFTIGSGSCGPVTRRLHQAVRERSQMSGPPPWEG